MTPEEEKVIEAALALAEADLEQPKGSFVSWHQLAQAAFDLHASRAPKKPITPARRASRIWSEFNNGKYDWALHEKFLVLIAGAESAAWDRAIEVAEIKINLASCRDTSVEQRAIRALKGRCHDA